MGLEIRNKKSTGGTMSISNDLENIYRKQGQGELADAVSALLGTNQKVTPAVARISVEVNANKVPGEEYADICNDIYMLLENRQKVSDDLRVRFSTSSTEFFSELLDLKNKFC